MEISIYNIKGQKVKKLKELKQPAGKNSIHWNGMNELGKPIASGVYLYNLKVKGRNIQMNKCIVVK